MYEKFHSKEKWTVAWRLALNGRRRVTVAYAYVSEHVVNNVSDQCRVYKTRDGPTDISPVPIMRLASRANNSGHLKLLPLARNICSTLACLLHEHTCREKCIAQLICVSSLPARPALRDYYFRSLRRFSFFFFPIFPLFRPPSIVNNCKRETSV